MTSEWNVPGYTMLRELGRGASGTVVLATHDATGTPVAVKYLSSEMLTDPAFRVEFREEARLLGEIEAPNVARLYEFVESPTGAAIVMEAVAGASLRAVLREHGSTEPESALCVLKGSLLGLGAAHAAGVVHRDYKPENVLVKVDGESTLVDFGIARRHGVDGEGSGTPAYMAPEQWSGAAATPRADIYAATATFVECLTGHAVYRSDDLDGLRRQHETAAIPADRVPVPVRRLVLSGLAKDPRERPGDAMAFLGELEAAASAGYGDEWERRGREALALLALLVRPVGGAVTGTGVATTVLGRGHRLKLPLAALGAGVAVLIVCGGAAAVFTQSATQLPVTQAHSEVSAQGGPTTEAAVTPDPTTEPVVPQPVTTPAAPPGKPPLANPESTAPAAEPEPDEPDEPDDADQPADEPDHHPRGDGDHTRNGPTEPNGPTRAAPTSSSVPTRPSRPTSAQPTSEPTGETGSGGTDTPPSSDGVPGEPG